jgi:uncharacterized protein (DUF2126 family)
MTFGGFMKQLCWLLIVVSTLLLPGLAFSKEQGCLKVKETVPDYEVLVQNKSLNVSLKLKSHRCHVVAGSQTVSLEAQPPVGMKLDMDSYSWDKAKSSEGPDVKTADAMKVELRAFANIDTAPGNYEVPATLHYQAVDKHGNIVAESTAFKISIRVLRVGMVAKHYEKPNPWMPLIYVGCGAAAIVLTPVVLMLYLVGAITGHPLMD